MNFIKIAFVALLFCPMLQAQSSEPLSGVKKNINNLSIEIGPDTKLLHSFSNNEIDVLMSGIRANLCHGTSGRSFEEVIQDVMTFNRLMENDQLAICLSGEVSSLPRILKNSVRTQMHETVEEEVEYRIRPQVKINVINMLLASPELEFLQAYDPKQAIQFIKDHPTLGPAVEMATDQHLSDSQKLIKEIAAPTKKLKDKRLDNVSNFLDYPKWSINAVYPIKGRDQHGVESVPVSFMTLTIGKDVTQPGLLPQKDGRPDYLSKMASSPDAALLGRTLSPIVRIGFIKRFELEEDVSVSGLVEMTLFHDNFAFTSGRRYIEAHLWSSDKDFEKMTDDVYKLNSKMLKVGTEILLNGPIDRVSIYGSISDRAVQGIDGTLVASLYFNKNNQLVVEYYKSESGTSAYSAALIHERKFKKIGVSVYVRIDQVNDLYDPKSFREKGTVDPKGMSGDYSFAAAGVVFSLDFEFGIFNGSVGVGLEGRRYIDKKDFSENQKKDELEGLVMTEFTLKWGHPRRSSQMIGDDQIADDQKITDDFWEYVMTEEN